MLLISCHMPIWCVECHNLYGSYHFRIRGESLSVFVIYWKILDWSLEKLYDTSVFFMGIQNVLTIIDDDFSGVGLWFLKTDVQYQWQ